MQNRGSDLQDAMTIDDCTRSKRGPINARGILTVLTSVKYEHEIILSEPGVSPNPAPLALGSQVLDGPICIHEPVHVPCPI